MVTNISPIFGLTLLEHADIWTIAAALAPAGVAGVIWWTQSRLHKVQVDQQKLQYKEQKRQADIDERQAIHNSALLVLELEKQMRTKEFRDVLDQIQWGWGKQFENDKYFIPLIRYINYISLICSFHRDGLITEEHIGRHYDQTIIEFDDNDWVHEYLKKGKEFRFIRDRLSVIRKKHPRQPRARRRPSSSQPSSEQSS